jgi:glycosyltransferase involved in cell wall biosynthesis
VPEPDGGRPFRPSFLSRLCEPKGLHTLCQAFARMVEAGCEDAVLGIAGQANAGDLTFWEDCRQKLVERGLEGAIDFRGEVDEVEKAQFFRDASVFCLPELYPEPRGVACLEAMAWGVPALVADHGIFPEIAELTGGARCLPPGDPDALADALAELCHDPERTAKMGRAAARGVAEHFSAEGMARRTEELLHSLK